MNNEIAELYETFEGDYLSISKKYLQISELEIDTTLMNHSAIYAYFAALLSYSKNVRDDLAIELDKQESLTMKKRTSEMTSAGKKVSQTALNSYVLSVPEIVELKNKLAKADSKYSLAKSLVNALDHQKDCLVQISANKRAEAKLFSTN
tara:strand:+ start:17324 stop:17770 length:447 start_codon:yes stop_codon:yes gene_type:complete